MQVTLTKPHLQAIGTGNSKKEAKQAAARAMLVKLDKEVKEMKTSCPPTPPSSSSSDPLIRVPLTSSSSSDQNRTPFLCRPCQVECTSKVSLEEHLKSKKHAKLVASV